MSALLCVSSIIMPMVTKTITIKINLARQILFVIEILEVSIQRHEIFWKR